MVYFKNSPFILHLYSILDSISRFSSAQLTLFSTTISIRHKWKNASNWRLVGKEEALLKVAASKSPQPEGLRCLDTENDGEATNSLLVLGPCAMIASQSSANRTKLRLWVC